MEITFSAPEEYLVNCKDDYPEPASRFIPKWFKDLDHSPEKMTIKGCMPFLDSLTTGYILKLPQDIFVKHNIKSEETNEIESKCIYGMYDVNQDSLFFNNININGHVPQCQDIIQLDGSPLVAKNKFFPIQKILNPWKIKTPPGYSCLFTAPLNNRNDYFEIMPAIVDTDTFRSHINFPFIWNDKYDSINTTLKKGTPYVQIIPFKRDNWKMNISKTKKEEYWFERVFYARMLLWRYKIQFWKKKLFK